MNADAGAAPDAAVHPDTDADAERRFGGLRQLWGDDGYARIRSAAVAVVGLGGVGSWAAEALARSGVGTLVLIDLDHVAESNINRQVQASSATLGQAKAAALAERIAAIHPGCRVHAVEEHVDADNWPALLPVPVQVVLDCCDQAAAKETMAVWSLATGVPLVCVGAAGGKRQAERVDVADLAEVSHDPLLARVRQRLRRRGAAPPGGGVGPIGPIGRIGRIGVTCVYSRESVARPPPAAGAARGGAPGAPLACAGYGSMVTVTATFGMVAAGVALARLQQRPSAGAPL